MCCILLIIGESIKLFLVQITCNSRITVTEIVKVKKIPLSFYEDDYLLTSTEGSKVSQ